LLDQRLSTVPQYH
jgi:hypothetical protein